MPLAHTPAQRGSHHPSHHPNSDESQIAIHFEHERFGCSEQLFHSFSRRIVSAFKLATTWCSSHLNRVSLIQNFSGS